MKSQVNKNRHINIHSSFVYDKLETTACSSTSDWLSKFVCFYVREYCLDEKKSGMPTAEMCATLEQSLWDDSVHVMVLI